MGFFHQEKNVKEYIKMAEGYDGRELIAELQKHLPESSSILEIGMGPGVDLTLLKKHYKVTGSDYSKIFIDRYQKQNPDEDLLVLDAITLKTNRKFQGLYSNKVLMHLTREDLKQSIKRQAEILEPEGIICHAFWHGDREENFDGLLFIYYTEEQLRILFEGSFDIIKMETYKEMEPDDSLFLIARKRI
ncbi:methyltransferase domain-containing protein [Promethearchaeum syntrophicum]|uniref:Methyltransferase domain-containing protein n=1 Tax=Promethearchaeum syntrophicum TaxID=2594042 RepID=A0A5B9DCA3_9ARCH|nr:class I SAM-dependent methyltransferase [Candidatus Prometheoarchaeum syntrophicum]QEE16383.1 trans-aconitate 2-methyltransferase [Candidatus Prometheoarchaeum syntrophicum]